MVGTVGLSDENPPLSRGATLKVSSYDPGTFHMHAYRVNLSC